MGKTTTPTVVTGVPPDPVGAVGPADYVQMVNGGVEVFTKSGAVRAAAHLTRTLWTGYTGTNAGNGCAARNDGDPIVRYDRLANRWVLSQISFPNAASGTGGPSFECVAVSKTGDPAGAYWLYDFVSDTTNIAAEPKIGVWPDAYYVTYNLANGSTGASVGAKVCAWDRAAMLAGQPATQQCFTPPPSSTGLLPADMDGARPPPNGSPEYVLADDVNNPNTLDSWKFHVDWASPANSAFTGPTLLSTAAFTGACSASASFACIPQSGTTQLLSSLGGRLMDRLAYRNLGDHESLVVDQSVAAGSSTGVRWYELRIADQTPVIYQQGTYAPTADYRWLGSAAQDEAGDIALGFSLSGSSIFPSIHYTGRLGTDPLGQMSQGEGTIVAGPASQTVLAQWGDYSSMTVDPSDDCTFWYTNEFIATTGPSNWQTQIASFKFPGCGSGDFSISANPTGVSAAQGAAGSTTVNTATTSGTDQSVALTASGLPPGTTASFNPSSVTSGQSSSLTLAASASTPPGTYAVTVGGKESPSGAYHTTSVALTVTAANSPPGTTGGGGGGGGGGGQTTTPPTLASSGSPSTSALGTTGILVDTGDRVTCPVGSVPCRVGVVGRARLPLKIINAAKTKLKTITVGSSSTTVPAGATKKITFKLNKKGVRLLRRLKRLRVTVTVTVRYDGLAPVVSTRAINIKRPKRHKR